MEYGRYRILHPLGQGGMATVYLAEDPLLQRLVAIKVIQAHLSSNSSLIDRFTVEAKTIAALRHVNIVEVFDFGVQDDQQFLVMEYIDGQNLQAICAALQGRPMDNAVAAAIICQAAEGLTSAEKHGVVHRDIKPENLMFNSEGQLKIADFGIAHIADEQSRTQTGAVLGSPNFMSPEQIEGLRPTHKTDLFSLGGVFYHCLTGRMPFTGPSIPVTMRNICERPHPPILEANPAADPFLASLTDLLLQKQPEARAESARWLANQLRAYLNAYNVVDIADHCRAFIGALGLGQNQTLAGPGSVSKPGQKTSRTGTGVSMGGAPSAVIRTGSSSMGDDRAQSRSLAGQSQFQTQATTGALGPSSRSPLVWVGALLSLCVLVLAGAIIWTRMEKGQGQGQGQAAETRKTSGGGERLAGNPGPRPSGSGAAAHPGVAGAAGATGPASGPGEAGNASAPQDNAALLASTTLRHEQAQAAARREAEIRRAGQIAQQRERQRREQERRERERAERLRLAGQEGRTAVTAPPKAPEQPQVGRILIRSAPPFAALTINGRPQGETPMSAFIEVPVGRCHIEIVHRLSPPFDTVINVTPGFQREYKFKLDR